MTEAYDVVVIGSGMGGLCAAALLANSGYKTLLAEKLPFIGGRCSTIEYKGFRLTTGAIDIETNGELESIFNEVHAEFAIHPHPPSYYRIGGRDYERPETKGLRSLVTIASEGKNEAERVMDAVKHGMSEHQLPGKLSVRDCLWPVTQNPKVLGIFQALTSSVLSANIDEIPASAFFQFLKVGFRTFGIAPKGNLRLMESLAKVIQAKNGKVWTRCQVKHISVEGRRVKGVTLQDDMGHLDVEAQVVISNSGPKSTVQLVGREQFDEGYLKELDVVLPASFIWIQVASTKPLIDYPGGLFLTESRRVTLIECPTMLCPELAPEGKHLLVAGGALPARVRTSDLNREIGLQIQDLKDHVSGFKEADILVVSCFHREWPVFHSRMGSDVPQKTPIENLYNVGDGVKPAGWVGLPACAKSARLVAEDVKKRIIPQA